MKGFFSVKAIIILLAVIYLFGGAVYDLTTTSVRCGMSIASPELGYGCNELGTTVMMTVIVPDDNIAKGVNGIMVLDTLDNETLEELGVMVDSQRASFMNQIFLGIIGVMVLFGLLVFLIIKATPSSLIHIDSKLVAIVLAFFILSFIMVASYIVVEEPTPESGFLAVFGDATPFRGLRTLLGNMDVLSEVVDRTGGLPGTLETDDILNQSDVT